MEDNEYITFVEEIKEKFLTLQIILNPNAFDKVRAETGIRNISLLDELMSTKKEIQYNKFENF